MNIGPLSGTSTTVNLPTNGATIYVQLETHLGGTILENNNTYTEFTSGPAISPSPVPRVAPVRAGAAIPISLGTNDSA